MELGMNIRDISNRVVAELEDGNSRKEIFQKLTAAHPADSGKIAYCIASVPAPERRSKYLAHNATLCVLLIVY